VIFLVMGAISRWKKTSAAYLKQQLRYVAIASVVLGLILPLALTLEFHVGASIATALGLWIVLGIVQDIRLKIANKPSLLAGLRSLAVAYVGMQIAHFGFAVILLGAALTSIYSIEKSVLLNPGEGVDLGNYHFQFDGTEHLSGPNYEAERATFQVLRDGEFVRELHPEKRVYVASMSPSTEMAIDAGFTRDLFITLGEERESGAWSMSIYIKPLVRWVWLGSIIMALGAIVAVLDKRYRRLRVKTLAQEASAPQTSPDGSGGQTVTG